MDALFVALGDGTRRRILDALSERQGQTLTELRTRLDASRQVVAYHLDILEAAGLVSSQRRGRCRLHFIDTTPLRTITERWPPSDPRPATTGLRTALDLVELGARLRAQRHRREHPAASEDAVRQVVDDWLMQRPGAPLGDSEGRLVPWPRPR